MNDSASSSPCYRTKSGLGETFWRDHQLFLQERGYMLRPRFMPGWSRTELLPNSCPDGFPLYLDKINHATRLSDNAQVCLKKVDLSIHPYEVEIGTYLMSEPVASDPENHCVPILEVLESPLDKNCRILVMPLLRRFDRPSFDTVGEVIDFIGQLLEGLAFIHRHNIAHRDCDDWNVMLDPRSMYPEGFHFDDDDKNRALTGRAKSYTRTQRPPKYYIIDFGLSRRYDPLKGPPSELPIWGGDRSVPEFQDSGYDKEWDPFSTDVYYAGNLIRENFLEKSVNFYFLEPLVEQMVHDDPEKRPKATAALAIFERICGALGTWTLRSRIVSYSAFYGTSTLQERNSALMHWYRRIGYILTAKPPIPRYSCKRRR